MIITINIITINIIIIIIIIISSSSSSSSIGINSMITIIMIIIIILTGERELTIFQFKLGLILLLKLDKRFPVEQFEATLSQSTVPSPPLKRVLDLDMETDRTQRVRKHAEQAAAHLQDVSTVGRARRKPRANACALFAAGLRALYYRRKQLKRRLFARGSLFTMHADSE